MRRLSIILAMLAVLLGSQRAWAVKIADITRLAGQRTNLLTGLGLVYGLKGTGDGGDFQAAIKPLAAMLEKMYDPVTVKELSNASNVAVVMVTATIPGNGVRNGDHIDCYVTSIGAAASIKGGRLFVTFMQPPVPNGPILAVAEGAISTEDPSSPNVGVVKGGCVMESDLKANYIEAGRFTLVLDDQAAITWSPASNIATIINDAEGNGASVAVALDPKTVEVTIPLAEREHPDSFISRVQRLPVPMLPTEARVVINEKLGTIVMTADVEISPVVISHKGLTITTPAAPAAGAAGGKGAAPVPTVRSVIPLDTTNQGGAKLQDLVNALDQLKVPVEDRISIVKELYKTGKLHAKLLVE